LSHAPAPAFFYLNFYLFSCIVFLGEGVKGVYYKLGKGNTKGSMAGAAGGVCQQRAFLDTLNHLYMAYNTYHNVNAVQ
jgi:hypothetical protein